MNYYKTHWWIGPLILLLFAITPMVISGTYYLFMLILIFNYGVVAIGLNLLTGYGGQGSLGHAALMAMGAYTTAILSKKMALIPFFAATGLHVWIGIIAGIIVALLAGIVLAYPSLRAKGPYLAMVTLAFGWVIWKILLEWVSLTGGELGITAIPKAQIGSFILTTPYYYYISLAAVTGAFIFQKNLVLSEYGRRLKAIKNNEIAASSVGIDVYHEKIKLFALSAAFAGFGGTLFAHQQNFINPDSFQFFDSVFILLAVLFGGPGTFFGPLVGVMVLVFLPELLQEFDHYRLIIYSIFILITLYFLPKGVVGLFKKSSNPTIVETQKNKDKHDLGTKSTTDITLKYEVIQESSTSLLEVNSVSKSFGGLVALSDFTFKIMPGQVHAVIGPNGAGKTTLINVLSGFYQSDKGTIKMLDKTLSLSSLHESAKEGISRTFQTIKLFGDMLAVENVMTGFELQSNTTLLDSMFKTKRGRNQEKDKYEEAKSLMKYVGLGDYIHSPADALSYGHRRLLEIARALAVHPRLLLLDEPAAGLVPEEIDTLKDLIKSLTNQGIGILLVEHHMDLVASVSDQITVIDYGKTIAQGDPTSVQRDKNVIEAYLGTVDNNA